MASFISTVIFAGAALEAIPAIVAAFPVSVTVKVTPLGPPTVIGFELDVRMQLVPEIDPASWAGWPAAMHVA